MKKLFYILLVGVIASLSIYGVGNLRTVNTITELVSTNNNPKTILTNYLVIANSQMFYWNDTSTNATNASSVFESLYVKDILGTNRGRFIQFFTNTTSTTNIISNSITLNPTDNVIPARSNATTLKDTSLSWVDDDSVQGTNFTTKIKLITEGAFISAGFSSYILSTGTNAIVTTNKSLIYLTSLNASNVVIQLNTGNGLGQHITLVNASTNGTFTLTSGPLYDNGSYSVLIRGDVWTPTELGEALLLRGMANGFHEEGRVNPNGPIPVEGGGTNYWTNILGTLKPILGEVGTNQFTIDPNTGWTGTGTNWFGDDGKFHNTVLNTNGGNLNGTLTSPYIPYAIGVDTLADSPLQRTDASTVSGTNLVMAEQLITDGAFLTRTYTTVVLTNGTNVINPYNTSYFVLASTDTNAVVQLDTGNGSGQHIWLLNYWTNVTFSLPSGPLADDTNAVLVIRGDLWSPTEPGESLELLATPNGWVEIGRSNPNGSTPAVISDLLWTNIASVIQPIDLTLPVMVTNEFRSMGFESGGDYSRLVIVHSGTNGSVVFDSQSSGIAGQPRPIDFLIGGTNGLRIANDIGAWPSNATQYFDGSGHWSVPAGGTSIWTNDNGTVRLITTNNNGYINISADDGAGGAVLHFITLGTNRWYLDAAGSLAPETTYSLGNSLNPVGTIYGSGLLGMFFGDTKVMAGSGDPEGVRLADPGSLYMRTNGTVTTMLYTKVSGFGTTTGWTNIAAGTISGGVNYWTNIGSILQPIDLTLPLMITNQIQFGPGTTNVLYRDGKDLYYTNANAPKFVVLNGFGQGGAIYAGSDVPVFMPTDGSVGVGLWDSSSREMRWYNNSLIPIQAGADFGADGTGSRYPLRNIYSEGTNYVYGYYNTITPSSDYSRFALYHKGTNEAIIFDSQAAGDGGSSRPFAFTNATVYIHKNIGAMLTVGATDNIDVTIASQTNQVSGAMTFAYATNGVAQLDFTSVRWLFNGSGSDQNLTINSLWRTNVNSPVPSKLTNATITVMYLKCGGPTDTSAKQTNCYVSFEYYK